MAENGSKKISFKKKLFIHRAKIFIVSVIIVVALAVILLVARNSSLMREYTSYSVVEEVERNNIEGTKVLGFGNEFITYSSDGIHCSDARGVDVWSFPYEMQSPMVDVKGKYAACADYNGRSINVFDNEGKLGSIQLNMPVKKICVSGMGVVAAVIDDGDVTYISLYYHDGSQIAKIRTSMSKSGYPVALGISDDSKLLCVSYLYLDSGELTTKLAFYNFGEVGQEEPDNLVAGYNYLNELVPKIGFFDNKKSFALANDKLLLFEGAEKPINTGNIMLQEQVHAVFYGDDRVGLVYLNSKGESKYKMDVYNASGKLENTFAFDMEYTDIIFANGKVIIYNSEEALIYSDIAVKKYGGKFEDSVLLLLPTKFSDRYVIVTPEAIKTIVLQ